MPRVVNWDFLWFFEKYFWPTSTSLKIGRSLKILNFVIFRWIFWNTWSGKLIVFLIWNFRNSRIWIIPRCKWFNFRFFCFIQYLMLLILIQFEIEKIENLTSSIWSHDIIWHHFVIWHHIISYITYHHVSKISTFIQKFQI